MKIFSWDPYRQESGYLIKKFAKFLLASYILSIGRMTIAISFCRDMIFFITRPVLTWTCDFLRSIRVRWTCTTWIRTQHAMSTWILYFCVLCRGTEKVTHSLLYTFYGSCHSLRCNNSNVTGKGFIFKNDWPL